MNFKDISIAILFRFKEKHNKILKNNAEDFFRNMQNNNLKIRIFCLVPKKF